MNTRTLWSKRDVSNFSSGFNRDKPCRKLDQQMIVVVLITYIWREIQNAEEVENIKYPKHD